MPSWYLIAEKMSTNQILIVVHFSDNFECDMSSPIYNDGRRNMLYLDRSITYRSFLDKVLYIAKWLARDGTFSILYLIQHGRLVTLVDVEGDDGVHTMMTANASDSSSIFLYVRKSPFEKAQD